MSPSKRQEILRGLLPPIPQAQNAAALASQSIARSPPALRIALIAKVNKVVVSEQIPTRLSCHEHLRGMRFILADRQLPPQLAIDATLLYECLSAQTQKEIALTLESSTLPVIFNFHIQEENTPFPSVAELHKSVPAQEGITNIHLKIKCKERNLVKYRVPFELYSTDKEAIRPLLNKSGLISDLSLYIVSKSPLDSAAPPQFLSNLINSSDAINMIRSYSEHNAFRYKKVLLIIALDENGRLFRSNDEVFEQFRSHLIQYLPVSERSAPIMWFSYQSSKT